MLRINIFVCPHVYNYVCVCFKDIIDDADAVGVLMMKLEHSDDGSRQGRKRRYVSYCLQ